MSQPIVWIIGDWRHADFSLPLARLRDRARCASFDDAKFAIAGRHSGAGDEGPAAILLVQSRPGQISERDVQRLHAAAPLARLVSLVGPWCEGEMRSGHPLPGIVRVPWRAWQTQLMQELGLSGQNETSAATMPRTATAADRIETALAALGDRKCAFRTAAICTNSRASYESIADVLDQFQIGSVWHFAEKGALVPHADLAIFDGWDQLPTESGLVANANQQPSPSRLLLLHFPRPDDHARAARLGITTVLAQTVLITDLGLALAGHTMAG